MAIKRLIFRSAAKLPPAGTMLGEMIDIFGINRAYDHVDQLIAKTWSEVKGTPEDLDRIANQITNSRSLELVQ